MCDGRQYVRNKIREGEKEGENVCEFKRDKSLSFR